MNVEMKNYHEWKETDSLIIQTLLSSFRFGGGGGGPD